jgi:hypothetical protein
VSTELNKAVNVVGVVTHLAYEFSDNFFYIQRGTGPNSGIKVFTPVDSSFVPVYGDSVRVSGYVDEFNCQTEVVLFADCGTILGHGRRVRTRQLANISDINLEQNESMLVTVAGPITVATGNDTTNLGSEFKIGSGANIAYVGDDTFFPDLVGHTVLPAPGMILDAVTGVVGYRRTNVAPPDVRANTNLTLRLEPRRAATWVALGQAYRNLGRLEEAESAQKQAVALEPDLVAARVNLADVYARRGLYDQAIATLEEALARDPFHLTAIYNLAVVEAQLGQEAEATALLEKVLAIDPGHEAAKHALARLRGEPPHPGGP